MSRSAFGRTLAVCAVAFAASTAEASVMSRIERYVSWQNAGIAPQDWGDCTQDAFVELLEHVGGDGWKTAVENPQSEERRELNRTIWRIVKRWQRAARHDRLDLDVADCGSDSTAKLLPEEWSALVREANLSNEQARILDQWSQGTGVADIARDMKLPAARVSDQKFKAIQKLRAASTQHESV